MPYWVQAVAWLVFWCTLGLVLRPLFRGKESK